MDAAVNSSDDAPFTSLLWSDLAPVFTAVLRHPFLTGLMDGTLPRECFRHYLVQDAHYLRGYARILSLCAAKADPAPDVSLFARHAAQTVSEERELHAALLAELGSSEELATAEPVGPTTQAYLDHLLAVAYGASYGEAVGAVLPCYWIYAKVGAELRAAGSPDPLYARWIDAYGSAVFQSSTQEVLTAADAVGASVADGERLRIRGRARAAARYEWMFWDAAYRRESWPV